MRAIRTSAESVEWLATWHPDEVPGSFEWTRETGEEVRMQVEPDGTIRTWRKEWVEQEPQKAASYDQGCEAVQQLVHADLIR